MGKYIDLEVAKKELKKYIKDYNIENPKIKLKVKHIYRVVDNSEIIAKNLGLDEEKIQLAKLIGLLHDIGRFEQIRKYNTFMDSKSVNHAEEGIKDLYKDNKKLLRKFIIDDKYDDIIYKAIINHNKLEIDKDLSDEERLFVNIIRDADKVDIFKVVTTDKLENTTSFENIDIPNYIISNEIYNEFNQEKLVQYKNINNCLDYMVAWTAYIYDINYAESLKIIKENNYIDKIFNMANNVNDIAKNQINEVKDKANKYINLKTSIK